MYRGEKQYQGEKKGTYSMMDGWTDELWDEMLLHIYMSNIGWR